MNIKIVLSLIIINEFCERFCFYGIRSTLYTFLIQSYGFSRAKSTIILHSFVLFCYFFAFLGGIVADNLLGRYKTIIYFNFVYMLGNLFLILCTISKNIVFLYTGLSLISIGTGGIKPCISAFGGDQIAKGESKTMERFFSIFYFSINAGSLIGMLISPILAAKSCFGANTCYYFAFKTTACMHFFSLLLFMLGSKYYTKNQTKPNTAKYLNEIYILPVINTLKRNLTFKIPFINKKRDSYAKNAFLKNANTNAKIDYESAIEINNDFKRIKEILPIFIFVSFFWMLFDQQSSSWIAQTLQMQKNVFLFGYEFEILPSQMQAVNAVSMVLMIPLFFNIVYPYIEKSGFDLHSIKKMYLGLYLSAFSFFISAFVEYKIYKGNSVNIIMQIPQYILITAGEVLVSITGLEFAYSQSPESMKSFVFSAWLATTALGNFYILVLTGLNPLESIKIFGDRFKNQIMYGCIGISAAFLMSFYTKNFRYSKKI